MGLYIIDISELDAETLKLMGIKRMEDEDESICRERNNDK